MKNTPDIRFILGIILLAAITGFTACSRGKNDASQSVSSSAEEVIENNKNNINEMNAESVSGEWTLIWSDEFDGHGLDMTKWNIDVGTGTQYGLRGWGNGELQYYKAENINVNDGILTIESKMEMTGGYKYSSGKITTGQVKDGASTGSPWINEKFSVKTGKVEARAKTPKGKGFWPAFWLLGSNSGGDILSRTPVIKHQVWPRCGEIDIFEFSGGKEFELGQTLHYGNHWQEGKGLYSTWMNWVWPKRNSYRLAGNNFYRWSDNWHIYGVVWDEIQLQFYVDHPDTGEIIITQTIPWEKLTEQSIPYTDAFYNDAGFAIILNLAIGGNLGGGTPLDSSFADGTGNHTLQVDWVRVYQSK